VGWRDWFGRLGDGLVVFMYFLKEIMCILGVGIMFEYRVLQWDRCEGEKDSCESVNQ